MSQTVETTKQSTKVRVTKPKQTTQVEWNLKSSVPSGRLTGRSGSAESVNGNIWEENRLPGTRGRQPDSQTNSLSGESPRFTADFSQVPVHGSRLVSSVTLSGRGPVGEDGSGDREQATRSATEAPGVTQEGRERQLIQRNGGPASVIPTDIATTSIIGDTPSLGPTYYGSIFQHALNTSGGTISNDVTIAEKVDVTRDDFNTGFAGVPLGTLTWGAAAGATAPLSGNNMFDNIGTNNINVTNFVPGPPGLPAIMETPQELHYRIGTGDWIKFADVPMVVTLYHLEGPVLNPYEVDTRVNGVSSVQPYTGPT
jgi:hypothetical protein